MKKSLILLSILLVTLIVLVGCASEDNSSEMTEAMTSEEMSTEAMTTEAMTTEAMTTESMSEEELPVFTLEELAKFDGQNGSAVYVGYEGKVYDVSNVEEWKTGTHRGRIKAGQDLTDVLNNEAPHNSQRLMDNAPVVGILE